MRNKTSIILILVALILVIPAAVHAQDTDLENALRGLRLNEPQVKLEADTALVIYQQPVADMGSIEAELERVARILVLFADHLPAKGEVTLQQRFDDGQIMQVVGSPALGSAFLDGEMDANAFEMALRFEPLTRGPLIFEGSCDLPAGDSCESNPACACYPDESCAPADPAANLKGCVATTEPANAHLEGSEWACNEGYVWNGEMTDCEATVDCPDGTSLMDGECVADVPTAEPAASAEEAPLTQTPEEDEEPLGGLIDPTWLLLGAGGCICLVGLLVVAAVVVFLVMRRRKKET